MTQSRKSNAVSSVETMSRSKLNSASRRVQSIKVLSSVFAFLILSQTPINGHEPSGQKPLILKDTFERINPGLFAEIALVPYANAPLDAKELHQIIQTLEFKTDGTAGRSFGYINEDLWVRMPVRDLRSKKTRLLLELHGPWDAVHLYALRKGELFFQKKAGWLTPEPDVALPHRNVLLDLPQGEPEYELYLHLHTNENTILFMEIFEEKAFVARERPLMLLFGSFIGFCICLILYNGFLWIALRDRVFAYYVLHIAGGLMLHVAIPDLADELLWPGSIWWRSVSTSVLLGLTLFTGSLFTLKFLSAESVSAPASLWLRVGLLAAAVQITLAFIIPYRYSIQVGLVLVFFNAASYLYSGIAAFLAGFRPARYYIAAWGSYSLAGALHALGNAGLGVSSDSVFVYYSSMFGQASEMILLALALADRYRAIRDHGERAMAESSLRDLQLQQIEAEKRTLELALLKRSIQPHFLMNSLNAALGLIRENPNVAQKLILALASEIRKILDLSAQPFVTMDEELALCNAHLNVMNLRLESNFKLMTRNIDRTRPIPPLIFLTLVENGITHQRSGNSGDTTFVIERLETTGAEVYHFRAPLLGSGSEMAPEGLGTKYIRSRLLNGFGTGSSLTVSTNNGEFITKMIIPVDPE